VIRPPRRRRGRCTRVSGANFAAVIESAGVFTNGTLIYDQPTGGTA
jgi:hypothetical protein